MTKRVGDIAKLTSGVFKKPGAVHEVKYLQAQHFDIFRNLQEVKATISLSNKEQRHLLENGDVLFAAKGSNNFAAVYQSGYGPSVASSTFIVCRISDPSITPEYFAWYLSNSPEIHGYQRQWGTTVPSISIKILSEIEIPIPSLDKQRKITEIQRLRTLEKVMSLEMQELKEQFIQSQLLKASRYER